MTDTARQRIAARVSYISIAGNALLTAFKLLAGVLAHSGAMLSDAVHSLSDIGSTVIVLVGIRLSGRASDKKHPYGHERFECVAAILLAVLLGAVGAAIGVSSGKAIFSAASRSALAVPGLLALIAAAVSIAAKEGMYWYTRAAAKKINSGALLADAWHHRSDALSSIGSFLGILGARLGFPILDPIAGFVICFFILKAAVDIFRDSVGKMTDTACSAETEERVRSVAMAQSGVLSIDRLHTRRFGDKVYVDLEIGVLGILPLYEAHAIADRVHDAIEAEFPHVKHCMIHINPSDAPADTPANTPENASPDTLADTPPDVL